MKCAKVLFIAVVLMMLNLASIQAQSNSPTPIASSNSTIGGSNSTSPSLNATNSFTASPSLAASANITNSTRTKSPAASPSPFSAPSIIFFTSLLCTVPTNSCCEAFNTSWASLVPGNGAELITIIDCYANGILTNVLFIQGGNSTNSSTNIALQYFNMGGCTNDLNVPCYPNYGSMNVDNWDLVLHIIMEGSISFQNVRSLTASPLPTASLAASGSNFTMPSQSVNFTASNTTAATNGTIHRLAFLLDDDFLGYAKKVENSSDSPLLLPLLPLLLALLALFF